MKRHKVTMTIEETETVPGRDQSFLWMQDGVVRTIYRVVQIHNSEYVEVTEQQAWNEEYARGFSEAQLSYEHEDGVTLASLDKQHQTDSAYDVGVRTFTNMVRENLAK